MLITDVHDWSNCMSCTCDDPVSLSLRIHVRINSIDGCKAVQCSTLVDKNKIKILYTVSQKKTSHYTVCNFAKLTDFQDSFTERLSGKFAIKSL